MLFIPAQKKTNWIKHSLIPQGDALQCYETKQHKQILLNIDSILPYSSTTDTYNKL